MIDRFEAPPNDLLDRRSEPDCRAVLEDWLLERGGTIRDVMPRNDGYGDGYGGGYGGDGGGDGYGDGDGGYGYGGYGYGGGDGYGGYGAGGYGGYGYGGGGDGGGYGYGDGVGGYGAGGYGGIPKKQEIGDIDMREGISILSMKSGASPYVLVGWLKRVGGDEWEIHGARCIRRFGRNAALAGLAAKGPQAESSQGAGDETKLLEAAAIPECVHRLDISRAIPCDESAWRDACPRPASWSP